MFDRETYQGQHSARLIEVVGDGVRDQISPSERMRRIIQSAIAVGNPFIRDDDDFIVFGNDGLNRSWFPTGSFQVAEDALLHAQQKRAEENEYSDGGEISTTFHVFTREGTSVSLVEK